jgi:hypothetical protein
MTLPEKSFRIDRTLLTIFQSNPARKNLTGPCLKFSGHTLLEKRFSHCAIRQKPSSRKAVDPFNFSQPDPA